MNEINNIKVSVSYEKPSTSKFAALIAEYEAAKKYADETVAYYKPLADMAEEAKMLAILDQLENIKEYALTLQALTGVKTVNISARIDRALRGYYSGAGCFIVKANNEGVYISWDGVEFTMDALKTRRYHFTGEEGSNILGNWEKWKVYETLEKDALEQVQYHIEKQQNRAEKQKDRLYNITKEVE